MKSGNIDTVLQEVWENWRTKSPPCEGCPHWGAGGGNSPFYGVDSLSPDVVFVGLEPGTASEEVGKTEEELLNWIQSEYPAIFDEYRQSEREDIEQTGMYKQYSNKIDNISDTVKSKGHDLHFTNVKKCREIEDGNLNKAVEKCEDYLWKELEALDPDAVVTFGRHATKAVYDHYRIGEQATDVPTGLYNPNIGISAASGIESEALNVRELEQFTVIPSVHFSFLWLNLPEGVDDMDEYIQRLVSIIDSEITG